MDKQIEAFEKWVEETGKFESHAGLNDKELSWLAWQAAQKEQAERIAKLEAALIRLRDCDWVVTWADRMDAVRDIAKEALED